ncbi:MAG: LysM peptidoglycan-binding domain-containing protein [Cytophagales bacterium]|nr:LysM peptidoglycan-binding domain-containing protein [Cytophagales bacterium]MDW8384550.1 LysM peptidoglycan-binding domain-containing protein [Flammeovirgaceae bacterium]
MIKLLFFMLSYYCVLASPLDSIGLERRNNTLYIIHRVEQGEKIGDIAKKYSTTIEEIKHHNTLEGELLVGTLLRIPFAYENISLAQNKNPAAFPGVTSVSTKTRMLHKVQRGDTYYNIAKRYGMSLDDLFRINKITADTILKIGRDIVVETTTTTVKPTVSPQREEWIYRLAVSPESLYKKHLIKHKVSKHETINQLSQRYKIEVDSIKHWNQLSSNILPVGKEIIVGVEFRDSLGNVRVRFGGEKASSFVEPSTFSTISSNKQEKEAIAEVNGVIITKKATLSSTTIKNEPLRLLETSGKAYLIPKSSDAQLDRLNIHFGTNESFIGCQAIVFHEPTKEKISAKIIGTVNQVDWNKGIIAYLSHGVTKKLLINENHYVSNDKAVQVKISLVCIQ